MHAREKFERLLYITSNRNVGKRYASPIFDAEFRSLSAERQLPLDYIFELEPVPPLAEMYVIYEMLRLVVSDLLFLRVNRSLRTTVLAAPAVSACVCALARGRVQRYRALRRAWECSLFFSKLFFFRSKGHVSRFCLARSSRSIQNWPRGCLFSIGLFFCMLMEFMAVKRARSCQFVVVVRLVFLP